MWQFFFHWPDQCVSRIQTHVILEIAQPSASKKIINNLRGELTLYCEMNSQLLRISRNSWELLGILNYSHKGSINNELTKGILEELWILGNGFTKVSNIWGLQIWNSLGILKDYPNTLLWNIWESLGLVLDGWKFSEISKNYNCW